MRRDTFQEVVLYLLTYPLNDVHSCLFHTIASSQQDKDKTICHAESKLKSIETTFIVLTMQ